MKHLNLTTARINTRLFVRTGLLAVLLAVAGTSLASDPGSISGSTTLTVTNAVLVSLEVTPNNPAVPAVARAQAFSATGVFSDGTTRDLTAVVTWSSSNRSVATISNADGSDGVASGISPGTTQISAQLARKL
jgi:hypothetical protein